MLGDNLKYLREIKKISQQQAAENLGLPRTTLGDYERNHTEPNIDMLCKIARYFNVRLDDLLQLQLDQLKTFDPGERDLKILAVTVDHQQRQNIELVDVKAEAGYLHSFQDPQYIRQLPRMYIPRLPQGNLRAFEISGDSMLPIESGSIVIGQYVEKINEIKNDLLYIVIHKLDGIVFKRVKVLKEKKEIQLLSDNPAYDTYSIPFNQIGEVWQYKAHLSFGDLKSTVDRLMDERLNDLQKKVNHIYKKIVKG
jgi:transcriptional regulator with XRE-family HTH domain